MQNTVITKKLLNAKEAREYLGFSRYTFEKAVNEGNIRFKLIGSKKFFPIGALDTWQSTTMNHTDCIKEAIRTTRISRTSRRAANAYSFAELQEKYFPKKQHNFA